MRVSPMVSAAVILFLSAPALAQEYVEFVSREDRFGVTFPVQPKVTETTYMSQFGASLPARVYSAEPGRGRYVVTVVDYSTIEPLLTAKAKSCPPGAEACRGGGSSTGAGYWRADLAGAVIYATWQFMQRNAKVTYLGWNNVDLVEGHMLSLENADQSRTSAAVYMHENRLYILEGTVPKGIRHRTFSSSRSRGSTRTATASAIRRCITTDSRSRRWQAAEGGGRVRRRLAVTPATRVNPDDDAWPRQLDS